VYDGNIEIMACTGIYSVSVSMCFVSEGQFTQLWADAFGEAVSERNVSMLDNGKLNRDHCDVLLPVVGKWKLGVLKEV
jgi:hypothetical protein